jgi:uncharacterized membrane protein
VKISVVSHQPQGPAFDVVLLLHVASVVVGLVTTVTSAATATRLGKLLEAAAPLPESVRRYFRPGVNWAGRGIWGIPIFGFALLAMSQGAYGFDDGWVMAGLAIFVVVVLVNEMVLWPGERRLQSSLAAYPAGAVPTDSPIRRDVRLMALSATVSLVLLIAGTVVMVAQP